MGVQIKRVSIEQGFNALNLGTLCTALSSPIFDFLKGYYCFVVCYFQAVFQTCFTKWGHPPIGCSSTVLSSLLGRTGAST